MAATLVIKQEKKKKKEVIFGAQVGSQTIDS
jgi:hypothetical protein